MNISLKSSKKAKAKTSMGYGLNSRSAAAASNVFGDDDSDDDDPSEDEGNGALSSRDRVNRQIAKEQAALRQRAQAAMNQHSGSNSGGNNIYDYDGAYDSFRPAPSQTAKAQAPPEERKSKYIGDLLQTANRRQRERDAIYERRVAKEQAAEDAQADYAGKEKFITKAYKRKLEERQQWEAEEKQKEQEELDNDVTKRSVEGAMASFYGNFNKNVAMGGETETSKKDEASNSPDKKARTVVEDEEDNPRGNGGGGGMGFLSGFERSDDASPNQGVDEQQGASSSSPPNSSSPAEKPMSMREKREKKVAEARVRYLERNQLALQ